MTVIIVMGLPASGKSYFAKHLAHASGAVYLNTDIVREQIGIKGQYDPRSNHLVYEYLLLEMMENILKQHDVVVDGTFQTHALRSWFENSIKKTGSKVCFFEITASEKTIRKRMDKPREHSEADFDVYLKIKKKYEPVKQEHIVLHSDQMDVNEMICIAKKYLYEQK